MSIIDGIQQQVLGAINQANPKVGSVLTDLLNQNGGVTGLVTKFQAAGLKDTVQSWVSTGANMPISAQQITEALGSEKVKSMAQKAGVDMDTITKQISEHLPTVIDKLTPNGQVPTANNILSNVINVAKNFFGGKQ